MVSRKLPSALFCFDACCVNAKGKLQSINQLETWHANGVIQLRFPEDAQREAERGKNRRRTRKSRSYWIPCALVTTPEESRTLAEIGGIIFDKRPLSAGEENDARIAFTARKYFSVLVTRDGGSKTQPRGILGAAADLAKLGVTVMSDVQAVQFVKRKIAARDRAARLLAERYGISVPDWVGRD